MHNVSFLINSMLSSPDPPGPSGPPEPIPTYFDKNLLYGLILMIVSFSCVGIRCINYNWLCGRSRNNVEINSRTTNLLDNDCIRAVQVVENIDTDGGGGSSGGSSGGGSSGGGGRGTSGGSGASSGGDVKLNEDTDPLSYSQVFS